MRARLGDIATYINGYAFKPSDWSNEGRPIIRIQDLTGNSYQANRFSGEVDKKYNVSDGDVLISWSASLGVYVWKGEDAVLNQHIFKVVFDKAEVNKSFFIHQVENILENAGNEAHGAIMKHLTKSVFDALPFYLPSMVEQNKIAERLDMVSRLIALKNDQLDFLDQLVKSRFVEMFGNPVHNSNGLPTKKLSEVGSLERGRSQHRPRNAPELLNGPYPLIQTGEVASSGLYIKEYHNTYSEAGLQQSKMWQAGTLCITIAANIAQTSILTFDACFPDSVVGFIPYHDVDVIYMHYWFGFFQKILEEQAPQVAQKNINLKILSELDVMVPPLSFQSQFASFVQAVDREKERVNESLEELETLKKALMQEYFG
ncbi:MAG: restriction endonuclease subunit S [Oscillospiraceae bacterium]|nr:restriction endonuclease subunit S [Oscillospiraceae bacterium]